MYIIIGILIIQIQVLGWTDATGKIATKFLNYHNPEGKQLDGSCCDKYSWWGLGDCKSGDTCDPGFVICLGNITESSSIDDCQYGRKTTGQLSNNANNIRFEEKVGEINNPLVFEFEEWPGIVKLNILAIDADGTDKYDIVDTFGYQYNKFDLVRELDTSPKTLQLSGSRSSLDLELKVFCDANYYGPSCKVYCVPRDDDEGHFMCDPLTGERNCMPGWSGDDCLTNKDDCDGNRCSHGSTCKDEVNSYTCLCPVGRTGRLCEAEINECSSNPCKHGGKCKDALGFFYCVCPVGTSGDYCEIDVIECVSDPCQNNATCVDEINAFQCVCQAGFTGELCEEEIDECASGPCVQAERCIDLTGDYQCVCTEGFTGKNCEINIDECQSKPCQNNGLCMDAVSSYTCICRDGTSGKYCEINFDECESNPCQNGGSCEDKINSYTCDCPVSYTGKHCETKIQPCDSKPCENGGVCVNEGDNFTCNCLPGFEGFTCEEDVNECESDPCKNGGYCTDLTGRFECRCPPNTSGEFCETLLETTTIPTTEPTTVPTAEDVTTEVYTDEVSTVITTGDMSTGETSSPSREETSSQSLDEVSSKLPDNLTAMMEEMMDNVTAATDGDEHSSLSTADNISTTPSFDTDATGTVLSVTDLTTLDGDNETLTTPFQPRPDVEIDELPTRDFRTTDDSVNVTEDVTESDTDNITSSILETESFTPSGLSDRTPNVTDLDSGYNVTGRTLTPETLQTVSPEISSEEIGIVTEEGSGDIPVTPVIGVEDTEDDVGSGAVIATEPFTMFSDVPDSTSTDTTTATSVGPGTTAISTVSDVSQSSTGVDSIEVDSTASGDFDEALTSLSPAETVGIDVSDFPEDAASGDTTDVKTSTPGTTLTTSKVIDEEDVGSGATDEVLPPEESTPDEPEYSVVTSDAPLTTPGTEVDSSGDLVVDTTGGRVDSTDGEVGSGEIVTSFPLSSTWPEANATSLLGTSQATPVTVSTSSPEKESLSSTAGSMFPLATDLFMGPIEENVFIPEIIGTTPPLLIFPDKPRSTTTKYVPKRTPKPYVPKTTSAPTEKQSSLETTTLELDTVTSWIYDTMSTLSTLFTTSTTTTTTAATTQHPPATTEGEAEPPPPILPPTLEPQDQRTNRGDLPPEEYDTTTPAKPTKATSPPVPPTPLPTTTVGLRSTPVPTKNIPYPSKSVTWPKPVMVKTTPKTTVIPSLGFPSIRTRVYHTVRNAYNVGKKIADAAYKKSKALLHRTIRRMTDLWKLCVRNAMKAVYTPYNYIRNLYTTSVNKGNRLLSNAYKYTYSGLRKVYGQARRTMSNYYNYLRQQYKKRYNYYYTQYYNYYRNLKNKWWNYFG